MNIKPMAATGAVACIFVIGGCSSPEPIDTDGLVDMRAGEALATLTGMEADLNVALEPGVDLDTDGAQQWYVNDIAPRSDVLPGDDITLKLQSSLDRAARTCYAGIVEDEQSTLLLDMKGQDAGSGDSTYDEIECVLEQLDIPASVLEKMGSTRALDGRQEGSWDGITAEWTYHPDDGLDIILTLDD